jgi:hypothetical protein
MLLKYTRAAGQRVLSPLEWNSKFMGEGRKDSPLSLYVAIVKSS